MIFFRIGTILSLHFRTCVGVHILPNLLQRSSLAALENKGSDVKLQGFAQIRAESFAQQEIRANIHKE